MERTSGSVREICWSGGASIRASSISGRPIPSLSVAISSFWPATETSEWPLMNFKKLSIDVATSTAIDTPTTKLTNPLIRIAARAYKVYPPIEPAVGSKRCLFLVAWPIENEKCPAIVLSNRGVMTRTKARLRVFVAITVIAALIGAGYAAFLDFFLRSDLSAYSFLRGALRGFIIGASLSVFEFSLNESRLGEALRRAPFLISLFLRTLASTAVLIGAVIISRLLLSNRGHSLAQWLETGLVRDFAFVTFIAFIIHFVLQTRRIVGGRVLTYFLLGRYNTPVVEERIFMLLDIVGSTAIAQRLGDIDALKLITRFFFDIAEPISRFDGETNIYVGDEVVVSWPMESGIKNARCLRCYAAICATMAQNQKGYIRDFGEAPGIRVGLHGGPVAAGECGDDRRQVVFIGDTINVAKRLQEACRDFDRQVLISGELLERIELPAEFGSEALGRTILRGRNMETHVHGIRFEIRDSHLDRGEG